ncbi:LLM class flavin-dependent oxidoreductase [Lysinibacillus yapensis]|uniref:LLM class flavin-dependent oxidoreductase n=1 Tax=Ureibacillus yapensis TaxID=2304605 RepID=A0A396S5E6_9BACL|nr:LLM class flavin-dependent oxidoreductase [Lysinibacillus yapensis]RHW34734.1 LLM class flavin-dependent oxidoreductase [Lysinibacillus yapensis]
MSYKIGILDQSPVIENLSNNEILQRTVELAQKAESWGYERFWVSEHHNSDAVLGSSPEVLVSYLLARTKTIRVGSGGVMLQHYSPYKVAENFQVLATLEPGRVDLGIGKGPGGLPLSTRALQNGTLNDGSDFEEKAEFLVKLLKDEVPETHPLAGIKAVPTPPIQQEIILLGASPTSAKQAKKLGVAFSYATFFNNNENVLVEAAKEYRENNENGRFILAIGVVAADTSEKAKQLVGDSKIVKVHLASGRTVTLSDVETAEKFGKDSGEDFRIEVQGNNILAGTPTEIKEKLDALYELYQVDEFILHMPIASYEDRLYSYELLSPKSLKNTELLTR